MNWTNWRKFAVSGLVVGMVAVTGCSSNLPETNQGNRNGQRVADAVNRREDTYRTTSNRLAYTENEGTYGTNGVIDRTTRGIRRAADRITHPTHTTTRSTSGNPLNVGRPQGRIGNTFHYGNRTNSAVGLNETNHGYDMGVTANEQALVNTRVTRNTTVNQPVAPTTIATTPKTETKRIDTKREATPAKKVENKVEKQTSPTVVQQSVSQEPMALLPINNRTVTSRPVTRSNHRNNQVQSRKNTTRTARYGMNLNTSHIAGETLGITPDSELTVPVVNNEDTTFFRKKVEEQPTTPELPVPPSSVQPQPASSYLDTSYDDSDYEDEYDSSYDYETSEAVPLRPINEEKPPSKPEKTLPTRTSVKRAMK